jgi:hypothetical protein
MEQHNVRISMQIDTMDVVLLSSRQIVDVLLEPPREILTVLPLPSRRCIG